MAGLASGGSAAGTGTGGGTGSGTSASGRSGSAGGNGTGDSGGIVLTGAVPLRQVYPENGRFDIIISHPSSSEAGENDRLLTGDPIYTVYIAIGKSEEWILRYCTRTLRRACRRRT